MRVVVLLLAVLAAAFCASVGGVASADYPTAVNNLSPDHYWRLNETVQGTAFDTGAAAVKIDGTHAGFFLEGEGEVGAAGPPIAEYPGFDAGNLAFGANDFASIGLGPGSALANSVMTVSTWFQVGIGFPGGSDGGDRIWTNNQSDGNVSFQLTLGAGANLVVGLNPALNGFPAEGLPSGDTVGNFQLTDATVLVKDEMWHHVVASRNGNNIEDVIIVVDGVHYDVDTWSDSTDTWGTTTSDAQIATRTPGDGGGSRHALNGPTDEVSVWLGRQLSVVESIGLYCAAATLDPICADSSDNPGDFDDSLAVGNDDLTLLLDGWGGAPGAGWTNNPPASVGNDSLTELLDNWGKDYSVAVVGATNVPEPTSMAIAFLAAISGLTLRRRA